eukprot:3919177-Pyramimonas_sp.AAC.1
MASTVCRARDSSRSHRDSALPPPSDPRASSPDSTAESARLQPESPLAASSLNTNFSENLLRL